MESGGTPGSGMWSLSAACEGSGVRGVLAFSYETEPLGSGLVLAEGSWVVLGGSGGVREAAPL